MKIKQKSYVKLEPKSRDPYLRRTDGEMIKIVKEIESGLISIRTACFKYGLCRNTLKLFITKFSIRTFGDEFSNQILSRMNDDQKESALNKKIQQLTKDLEYAKLKIISLETMITVAENDLKIKIRKKRGTKQLKE
jgi:hypothetical protein